ncbi:interleukin-15 isoform 2-T2 [Pholidichthys leucotaenia]
MTDFKKVPPVTLLQHSCPGDQAKGFQWTCKLCRESHKTQVWLCFLVLSLLSTSTFASEIDTRRLQQCLRNLRPFIEKSDAMLYAPSTNDITDGCTMTSLKCYLLELIMITYEEEVNHPTAECFNIANYYLHLHAGCPPCEAYSLGNITVFLDNLQNLLEYMTNR